MHPRSHYIARPQVTLMSEYMWPHPLWTPDRTGPHLEELSDELQREVNAWNELFDNYFSHRDGWINEDRRADYAAIAPGLRRRIQNEVGLGYRVVVDLWPLGGELQLAAEQVIIRSTKGESPIPGPTWQSLSQQSRGIVQRWDALFQDHHLQDSTWDEPRVQSEYKQRIRDVMRQVQADLGSERDVVLDAWPLPLA